VITGTYIVIVRQQPGTSYLTLCLSVSPFKHQHSHCTTCVKYTFTTQTLTGHEHL